MLVFRDQHLDAADLLAAWQDRAASQAAEETKLGRNAMRMVDLSHSMNVHTPGWVGYAGNKMYYAQTLQTQRIVAQRIDLTYDVVPGITAIQALTARHRIPLNRARRQ